MWSSRAFPVVQNSFATRFRAEMPQVCILSLDQLLFNQGVLIITYEPWGILLENSIKWSCNPLDAN